MYFYLLHPDPLLECSFTFTLHHFRPRKLLHSLCFFLVPSPSWTTLWLSLFILSWLGWSSFPSVYHSLSVERKTFKVGRLRLWAWDRLAWLGSQWPWVPAHFALLSLPFLPMPCCWQPATLLWAPCHRHRWAYSAGVGKSRMRMKCGHWNYCCCCYRIN